MVVVGARVVAISPKWHALCQRLNLGTMFVDLDVLSLAITKLLALDVSFVVLLFVFPVASSIAPGGGGVCVLSCFRLL